MRYLRLFDSHDSYNSCTTFELPNVSYDLQHVHYKTKSDTPIVVILNAEMTLVIYSKKLGNGYSGSIVVSLDDIGGELQLNTPIVFYNSGETFTLNITYPTSSETTKSYLISNNDDSTLTVGLEFVDAYPIISPYIGMLASSGLSTIDVDNIDIQNTDINTNLD